MPLFCIVGPGLMALSTMGWDRVLAGVEVELEGGGVRHMVTSLSLLVRSLREDRTVWSETQTGS